MLPDWRNKDIYNDVIVEKVIKQKQFAALTIFLTDVAVLSQSFEEPHRHHTWLKDMLTL